MDEAIARVERALAEIRAGRMVILVDDEDRENEGDLVLAAELTRAEDVNFMVRHARGLVCLALTEARAEALELPLMVEPGQTARATAFTVSIEARHGVTTGISAADRAHTIRTAVDPHATARDLVRPGHVFPLRARPGGVLQRTGHTEGSVDLARLAGCQPAAVICEIMNDDGTMARKADLERFADTHGLHSLAIADLMSYRLLRERLVHRVAQRPIVLASGVEWQARVYEVDVDARQFLALTLGEMDERPTLVRVHTESVFGDVFRLPGLGVPMDESTARIEREGRGAVLFLPRHDRLTDELRRVDGERRVVSEAEVQREFGLGAQVLADLGLGKLRILTSRPRRYAGLEAYGLSLVEQILLRDAPHAVLAPGALDPGALDADRLGDDGLDGDGDGPPSRPTTH